jgi:hypothetical protein
MFLAHTIDGWITLSGGLVATWLGYRPIPAGDRHVEWLAWQARWGRLMRVIGPLLIIVSLAGILVEGAPR